MGKLRRLFSVLITVLLIALIGASGPTSQPTTGVIKMTILSPDGQPAAKVRIDLSVPERLHSSPAIPNLHAATDELGVARITVDAGVHEYDITAAELGYTSTGQLAVYPGMELEVPLPRLAPLIPVDGIVRAARLDPATTVTFQNNALKKIEFPLDANGTFKGRIRCGTWFVSAGVGDSTVAATKLPVTSWGEPLHGITLQKVQPPPAYDPLPDEAYPEPTEPVTAWVKGTVRDENGKPVKGAQVCAIRLAYNGIGFTQDPEVGMSDSNGRYEVRGSATSLSGTVVAFKQDMAPAIAWFDLPGLQSVKLRKGTTQPTKMASPPPAVCDLVLSSNGATLDVAVDKDNKPARGAFVKLWRDGTDLNETWADHGGMTASSSAAEQAMCPTAVADADGIAHFHHLLPGTYTIASTVGKTMPGAYLDGWVPHTGIQSTPDDAPFALVRKQIVLLAHPGVCSLQLHEHRQRTKIELRRHDGTVSTGFDRLTFEQHSKNTYMYRFGSVIKDGKPTTSISEPGLWTASLSCDAGAPDHSQYTNLNYEADTVVASSAFLNVKVPPVATAGDLHKNGTIDIELRDVHGKPTCGIVSLMVGDSEDTIGTTDPGGHINFHNVSTYDNWSLRTRVFKRAPIDVFDNTIDSDFRGRTVIPDLEIPIRDYDKKHVILQEQSLGYARGRLAVPTGTNVSDYQIYTTVTGSAALMDASGRFVIGPFKPGSISLQLYQRGFYQEEYSPTTVLITAGQVTGVNLIASRIAVATAPEPWFRPPGDWQDMPSSTGLRTFSPDGATSIATVLLADRTTAAWDARIYIMDRHQAEPGTTGDTDAAGKIHLQRSRYGSFGVPEPGTPPGPLMIAILPGTAGAVFQDLNADPIGPYKLILPQPISVAGTVVVEGSPIEQLGDHVTILARYQDKGALNDILSVWSTPDEGGRFQLTGLTPGTYKVQAAVDGIWLSQTETMTVGRGAPKALTLNIGKPGGPVSVKVLDVTGKPVVGHTVTVDRPEGPLCDLYWPKMFITDGAGVTCIPALEQGPHVIHVDGKSYPVDAPPPICDRANEITVKLQSVERNSF